MIEWGGEQAILTFVRDKSGQIIAEQEKLEIIRELDRSHPVDLVPTFLGAHAVPEEYRDSEYVFLANIHPGLQLKVLQQIRSPRLVICDTMNFWIENQREALLETISHVDYLLLNDAEAREQARPVSTNCTFGMPTTDLFAALRT